MTTIEPMMIANYAAAWMMVVLSVGATFAVVAGGVALYRAVFKK